MKREKRDWLKGIRIKAADLNVFGFGDWVVADCYELLNKRKETVLQTYKGSALPGKSFE